jgi:hypothetical protein
MEPTNAALDGSSRSGVPVRFLGPSPQQEDKRNRGRESGLYVLHTHTMRAKKRARKKKKSLCLPVGEAETLKRVRGDKPFPLSNTPHLFFPYFFLLSNYFFYLTLFYSLTKVFVFYISIFRVLKNTILFNFFICRV